MVDQRWLDGSGNDLDRVKYTYDRNSNPTSKQNVLSAGHSEYFEYDGRNRLERFERGTLSFSGSTPTGTTGTTRTLDWSLDTVGNWSSLSTNGTAVGRTHDLQNRPVRFNGVDDDFGFDANGDPIGSQFKTEFAYDAWNQLVYVEGTDIEGGWVGVFFHEYDALGRRYFTLNGEETYSAYIYSAFGSGGGQVLMEWVIGGNEKYFTWSIAYENGLVSADTFTGSGDLLERVYVHTEANWNTSSTLRGEANLGTGTPSWSSVERYAMDPYGANVMVMDSAFGVKSGGVGGSDYGWHVHFQGGFTDLSTGLIRFGAREYDPVQGRWKQQDPLGWPDGANVYEFVRGNPLTGVDPSGMYALPKQQAQNDLVEGPAPEGGSSGGNGGGASWWSGGLSGLLSIGRAGLEGAAQGLANGLNGTTDMLIEGWNLGAGVFGGGRVEPPNWSRDLIIPEADSTHEWSKSLAGGLGIGSGPSALGKGAVRLGKHLAGAGKSVGKGTLRSNLGKPPRNLTKPQAHHDLPRAPRFQKHWKRAGLDPEDAKHGRWVERGPPRQPPKVESRL